MRIVIDACVLFPPLVRAMVLQAGYSGLFQPVWSSRILEEWRLAWLRKSAEDATVTQAQAVMHDAFPNASVAPEPDLEVTLSLPDPADAHVLATAITGQAETILTFNLRDFPRRTLAGHGIEARHPDGFMWELLSGHPETLAPGINKVLADQNIAMDRARAALKRARLPRFGKAWEAMANE